MEQFFQDQSIVPLFHCSKANPLCVFALDVQVGHFQRVLLDKLPPGLYLLPHQGGENLLRGQGVSHSCSAFISPRPL
jgi:hypothetical protein